MKSPASILIIRPSALGDVCRSVPVLASLRRTYPAARIDWLVQDAFAPAIEHHPGLTEVLAFPRRELGAALKRGGVGILWRWLSKLRQPQYDMVLDCQGLFRSGFFAWWTGAPVRIGYANARELGWLGLNTKRWVDPQWHAVDRMLELVKLAGAEPVADMRLYTGWRERQWVSELPELRGRGFAVVAPTSRWPGKRWPGERFAAVVEWLLDRGVEAVVVVGGAGERDQCGPVLALARQNTAVVDLIGRTTVGQLMALVQQSVLVIANDSAALHMAVGFDRPLVALFGPTDVRKVGPYKREADVVQFADPKDRQSHKHEAHGRMLMERISVEEVIRRVEALHAVRLRT